MKRWGKLVLWLLLAVPAALMVYRLLSGETLAMELYHPSGEISVRLMILALLPGPLVELMGNNAFLRGWLSARRSLGVAAFGYAALHLGFYLIDMRLISAMLAELPIPGIWTGWVALAVLIVPAAISSDAAMRTLGRRWKLFQKLVYPAFVLAIVHWLLLDWEWLPALIHLAPLLLVWSLRFARRRTSILSRSMA